MIAARYVVLLALAIPAWGAADAGIFGAHDGQCIKLRAIKAESAESDSSLIFHTNDGRAFRNVLPAPCDGLLGVNDLGKLGLKGTGDMLCADDLVWVDRPGIASSFGLGGDASDAGCKLGAFEPISEMSLSEFLRR